MPGSIFLFDCLLFVMDANGIPTAYWILTLQSYDQVGGHAATRVIQWAAEMKVQTGRDWVIVDFGPSGGIHESIQQAQVVLKPYFMDLMNLTGMSDAVQEIPDDEPIGDWSTPSL